MKFMNKQQLFEILKEKNSLNQTQEEQWDYIFKELRCIETEEELGSSVDEEKLQLTTFLLLSFQTSGLAAPCDIYPVYNGDIICEWRTDETLTTMHIVNDKKAIFAHCNAKDFKTMSGVIPISEFLMGRE